MPAGATAEVEKSVARHDPEAVEVDGQHEATGSRSGVRLFAASVIAFRYRSTVACAVAVQLNRSSTRARVEERFSWTATAQATVDLYRKAITDAAKRRTPE